MKLSIPNPSLYTGMTLAEILAERRATLQQIELFQRQRPSAEKAKRIREIREEIRSLEAT